VKELRNKFIFWLYSLLKRYLLGLSDEKRRRLARRLGGFLFALGLETKIGMRNLEMAFGEELNQTERKTLLRECYRFYCVQIFEILRYFSDKSTDFRELFSMDAESRANLEKMKSAPCLILTCHYGNWEFATQFLHAYGVKGKFYSGRQKMEAFEQELKDLRNHQSDLTFGKSKNSLLAMQKFLKNGYSIGMLADLDDKKSDLFVNFFGKPATASRGPSLISVRKGYPAFFLITRFIDYGKYFMEVREMTVPATGDNTSDELSFLRDYMSRVEAEIRKEPAQYLWINKRWRTRPAGEKNIYR